MICHRKEGERFMNRKRSLSLFWEFILIYSMLVLLTSVLLGSALTTVYLCSINQRSRNMMQSQAERAIDDLEAQLESMHTLSLKLSVQHIYTPEYFRKSKVHEIELLNALKQYQSYLSLANEFLLIYPNENGRVTSAFKSDGTKTDLNVYFNHFQLNEDELHTFLFECTEKARILTSPSCLLIAYPVRNGTYAVVEDDGTLCFVLSPSAFADRIEFTSNLQPGSYSLSYLDSTLIACDSKGERIAVNAGNFYSMNVFVPEISLWELISGRNEMALFLCCIGFLMLCIVVLARRCYKPIRLLINKYSDENSHNVPNNEWAALDQVMEQLQTRSQFLNKQADNSKMLLRNYALLMLFNNVSPVMPLVEFEKIGLIFEYSLFCVLTIAPSRGEVVSQDNMNVVASSMDDVAEDEGILYAIECDTHTHTLAVLCNIETIEQMGIIQQRVRTYLNLQSIRFSIGVGTMVDSLKGISSSYLAALGRLAENERYANDMRPHINAEHSESADLLGRMLEEIEHGDCQSALLKLEAYMNQLEDNASELMRRYNLFNIKCAIQQLCERMNYNFSGEQISMILTNSDAQSVHYALLQLIPSMCAHAQSLSSRAVVSASSLVMEYIHNHFYEYDISAQSIAEAVGIGINRTTAIIKEATGQSCKSYLIHLRLDKAKSLLLESDAPVSDICSQVGYNSVSHFIKVFKSATGKTPDAYRRGKETS